MTEREPARPAGWDADDPSRADAEEAPFVDDLTSGAFSSADAAIGAAARLGYDLVIPHGLLLITPLEGTGHGAINAAADELLRRLPGALVSSTMSVPQPHAALLVATPSSDDWDRGVKVADHVGQAHAVAIVAAGPATGPLAINAAYLEAVRFLAVAAGAPGRAGLVSVDDLFGHRVLDGLSADVGAELSRKVVKPLASLPETERRRLVSTLWTYYDYDGNVVVTARRCQATPRTVRNRLARVERATGLSVTRNRLHFLLALHHPDLLAWRA